MAYGLKYYALSVDRNDLHWELDIYQEGYVGSGVTELRGASPAFSLIYEGENDDLFSKQILPSRLEARLIVQDNTFLLEVEGMISASETEWRFDLNLVIGVNKYLKWRGNLLPDAYERQRTCYPFEVVLVATDGLSRLQDVAFEDELSSSPQYVGRDTQLAILVKCINKLGHELDFVTTDEWFETTMSITANDDPLGQADIDQVIYWDAKNNAAWSCYDVLTDILRRKSLQLVQSIGSWFITQLPEAANADLVERRYDETGAAVTQLTVDRSLDVDNVTKFIEAGSIETAEKPVLNAGISYDHGILQNYLSNGDFERWNGPVTDPLVWTVVDKGSGAWQRSADHYSGNYSFQISSDVDGPPYNPSTALDPGDVSRIEQMTFAPVLVAPDIESRLQLNFAHKYTLLGGADLLCQKDGYFALVCGDYAIQIKPDYSGFEWVANSGNPTWCHYSPSEFWWGTVATVPIDTPPTQDKITAYFTTLIERVPLGHLRTVDSFFIDAVELVPFSNNEAQIPTTLRTVATLNSPVSTFAYDLGVVHHGDGPVYESDARMTIHSGGDDTVLWTRRNVSSSDDLPLSSLQTSLIASAQHNSCRILSGNIIAQLYATTVLVVDGVRYAFRGGTIIIDDAECEGVWQEIKDDGVDSIIDDFWQQESGGGGGTGGGGTGGGGGVGGSILDRFSSEAVTIIAAVNKFHSNSWDGVLDGTGHISTPGTIGWIVAGGDDFEFIKGPDDYIRGTGSTLEIALTSELPIRRAAGADALSIINPTASTALIQQSSPWLQLTCHAWDTTTSGGMDTEVPWRIRNEAYASPGHGGGVLVFKVESQYIRRPFAIDEQGRMLLAYGSGPFSDQDTGPYYGFNGEDFGQWPVILAANIGGLNKVVVGWPENAITTDLYVTGKTYHYDAPIPHTNDLTSLGTTSNQWSDLFLASGGVINFANGNAAITHSTGLLTFSTPIAGTSATFTKTTKQMRLAYDGTNFIDTAVSATGGWVVKYKDGERLLTVSNNNVVANAFVGYQAGNLTASGGGNFGGGSGALGSLTSGTYNLGFGHQALTYLTDGGSNTGVGIYTLLNNVHGSNNVGLGREAGANCTTDAGVFIGYRAGYFETGAGKLFIDNAARASEADGRAKAMIYGVFSSAIATQTLQFNAKVKITNDIHIDGLTISNPAVATSGQQQHSPWLLLECNAWETIGGVSQTIPWRIRNEGYASPGSAGGCLVFKVQAQYIRRPIAIDENGRMILGYGQGPKTFDGETIYGFAGEDFGAGGGAGTGNWPIILAADIAGLNRVVVGWPTESIVSDLYVTGKVAVSLLNGETLATSCTLSSGTGVPGAAEPNGSLYMRRDGAAGTSLYIRTSGAWVGIGGASISSLNGLTGATQTFTNDTNITIVSGGTAHVITWSGTLAAARVGNLPASKITSGTFADSFLDTISTAGKVSGGAITSGTIGGSTIFNSSGAITTTGVLTVTGASYVRSVIVKNPTASTAGSQVQHSPYIELICQSWDTSNARNDEVPWRLLNEAYPSPGHGGGCLVFYTSSQYNRRPWAIDENGRGILGTGVGPYTINGETIYGFHGEDFGSYGNWPLILEGSIAGLNKVVVGSPPNNVTSDLYVTGVIYTMTSGARGTAHQVVGAQQAAIANATDAASVIARLNDLLGACRTHGLIAT
jgi:hypothetical protein